MKQLKHCTFIGVIFVLITGTLAHFLYDWSGKNFVIGFFTPINESIWEHIKLLFFPMLIYAPILILKFRRKYPCIISALCLGILAGSLLIPILYYTYTSIAGSDVFVLDIGIFILSTIIAFRLSYKLSLSCRSKRYTLLLCILTVLLFACFIIFTYHPPGMILFEDPAASRVPAAILSRKTIFP